MEVVCLVCFEFVVNGFVILVGVFGNSCDLIVYLYFKLIYLFMVWFSIVGLCFFCLFFVYLCLCVVWFVFVLFLFVWCF